jgi:hypothetical protein
MIAVHYWPTSAVVRAYARRAPWSSTAPKADMGRAILFGQGAPGG